MCINNIVNIGKTAKTENKVKHEKTKINKITMNEEKSSIHSLFKRTRV